MLLAALLSGSAATGAPRVSGARATPPPRVMSIGLCADQMALQLLPPERIASVSWLARETTSAGVAAAARRVPANRQSAEEVLRARPALVLADMFSAPATVQMLRRLAVPMLDIGNPRDFAAIRRTTLTVGEAADAAPRARALVRRMDGELAALRVAAPAVGPRVAPWDGTGSLPAAGTLYDAVVTAAGARNIGREPTRGRGGFHLEALLAARPDLLLHDDIVLRRPGRQAERLAHPLVRRLYRGRQLTIAQEQFVCGSPATVEAAVRLRKQLGQILPHRGRIGASG